MLKLSGQTENTMVQGGCYCGEIRYEIDLDNVEHRVADCHCTICRRTSGAPYVTWLLLPKENFRYVEGTPAILQSSAHGTRYFCKHCGTPLVCLVGEHPERIDVTTGSLDRPEQFEPTMQAFTDTKLPWL